MMDDYYMDNRAERLFVYGTMKQGFRNHERISLEHDSVFLGDFVTEEARFTMKSKVVNGYVAPVVLPNGLSQVSGELYQIDTNVLEYIDIMEGHPNVYRRHLVMLAGSDKSAWMYLVESDHDQFSANNIEIVDGVAVFHS